MDRNPTEFPLDEHGDILWAMFIAGDDLNQPRDVTFSVFFMTVGAARSFAAEIRRANYRVQVNEFFLGDSDEITWDVVAKTEICPSYERISAISDLLSTMAESRNGYFDGWSAELSPSNSVKPKPRRGST